MTPPRAALFVAAAQRYASSFKIPALANNRSPFVAARQAPAEQGGRTAEVYSGGFYRRGLAASSSAVRNFVLWQACGPPPGCNDTVVKLVREKQFAYVANARCAVLARVVVALLTWRRV